MTEFTLWAILSSESAVLSWRFRVGDSETQRGDSAFRGLSYKFNI